jgi:hypothetical protein
MSQTSINSSAPVAEMRAGKSVAHGVGATNDGGAEKVGDGGPFVGG